MPGWTLLRANSINDAGWIVDKGLLGCNGRHFPWLVPHQEAVFESKSNRVALGAIVWIVRQLATRPLGNGLATSFRGEFGFVVGHKVLPIAFRALRRLFFEIAVYDPLAVSTQAWKGEHRSAGCHPTTDQEAFFVAAFALCDDLFAHCMSSG